MGLGIDMHRAFSSWSSGSQQAGGDSVQKTVSQVEWMGMSNTLVRNSLGRMYWHYSSSNYLRTIKVLSSVVLTKDICSDMGHKQCS